MPLRIVFMGTPEFAVPSLNALVDHGHDIVACYTQPPRPAGRRGLELRKSPVHEAAEALGIPVHTPVHLKERAEQVAFSNHDSDVAIVIAYGLLLPRAVLDAPKFGCFNGHASILPRWRGAAPIQRAIMAGDIQTGVSIMRMDIGLDTGPVALEERVPIDEDMSASQLHDRLSQLTADLMVDAVAKLARGDLTLNTQAEDGIEYAAKISKEEARINWNLPAQDVHNHIRGLSPFPGAWCEMEISGKTQRVKILESRLAKGTGMPGDILDTDLTIACGKDAVQLIRLQRAGKTVQDKTDFLRGNQISGVN